MTRALLIVAALVLAACKSDPVTLEFSGEAMGTTYNITAIDATGDLAADQVQKVIDATLVRVNAQMSNWDPNSEISQFNANPSTDPLPISDAVADVVRAANVIHDKSDGQFDVTLGPLIQLWGFGARNSESPMPADNDIAAALARVGQSKVLTLTRDPTTLQKSFSDTNVWLAAIAKGYGVDALGDALSALGVSDFMVEIGGDLVTSGKNPDGADWRIGIERPDAAAGTVEEVVTLSGLGMATSGDYRNYFEEDGVRYSHIIDAVSGRPITHTTASVTVLTDSAMMADGWATALLALGSDRGLPIAEEEGLAVLFIDRMPGAATGTFEMRATSAFTALQPQE